MDVVLIKARAPRCAAGWYSERERVGSAENLSRFGGRDTKDFTSYFRSPIKLKANAESGDCVLTLSPQTAAVILIIS